ncbi:MAG: hypothetical protein KAS13_03175 [Candidatus Omnitrophica bacterium]|nr:hypothetical protein [Candidatus Omnitrophota bacterium]
MINHKTKKIFLALSCWLLICNVCNAQNELLAKSRVAKQRDIIGTWKMTYQTVSPLFKDKSLFFANHQIFQFFEDGYVKNISSKKRLAPEKVSHLLQSMPKSNMYGVVDNGMLIIERSKHDLDVIAISIAIDDFKKALRSAASVLKKGDLIVSYRDPNQNLYMQRYLRRLTINPN